ncbi:F-box protein FBW2 [Heracleum sosnowskyi]|uniref:F-box protein FBW2 n=1 Tax=Heracleum sosnowskyi TaxID=360622 RepID=A0AAD8JES6_9APIA|nr:F-box protein FBW2 [Heracleum sosnowskyi]
MRKRVCEDDEAEHGKWESIPEEMLVLVVVKIPVDEMMRVVPLVCKAWWGVVSSPHCWKNINLSQWSFGKQRSKQVDVAVKKLVGYSKSSFQMLSASRLGNSGFAFAANRAKCLKILTMPGSNVTDQMVMRHAESLANLTHLDVSHCLKLSSNGLEAFGKHCKSLIHLKRNMAPPSLGMSIQEQASMIDESEAMVIANTMSKLEHLEINYGRFTNRGINSVLNKCKALSYLDIWGCWNVWPDEGLEKKCEELAFFLEPLV